MKETKNNVKQLLAFFAALLILGAITSPLLAQGPSSTTDTSQHHGMQGMSGADGMMSGKAGMCSGGMMCPMMGSGTGMGMGMMMGMMVLMGLFWIAAIFALVALGLFLLRRSRTPVAS